MDIRKLQRAIVDGLEDVKAQNISVFNTEHLSALFERVIIASGTSNRQTKALASSVRDSVKSQGLQVLATEGEDNGEWIIVDCGAAVAHIMQPAIREYYHLEEIWGGKAVRLKLGAVTGGLVKASEPEPPVRTAARAAGAPASAAKGAKAAKATKKAAKKAVNRAARQPAAKAPGVKKAAGARTAGARTAAAKAPGAKAAAANAAAGAGRTGAAPSKRAGGAAGRAKPPAVKRVARKAATPR